MNTRAYTYIDRAHAAVGNRWLERRWSAFLGNTTGLLQKEQDREWLAGRSAEFRLTTEEEVFEAIDFGETSWSEENSPRGATLVALQRRPGLEIEIRTLALHDHPAVIRSVMVRNKGMDPIVLQEVIPERLPLLRDGTRVYTGDFSESADAAAWDTTQHAAALVNGQTGLFFGREGGGRLRLFTPDERECAVHVPGPGVLGRSEVWRTAPTFLIPFTGEVRDAAATTYAQFLTRHFTTESH